MIFDAIDAVFSVLGRTLRFLLGLNLEGASAAAVMLIWPAWALAFIIFVQWARS